ncbi:DNA-binding response regulator [Thermus scotoductus]|uniref:DNA-binding response regulator n=2 Tax=Thermus scotoductus TaxID=37636 RepID=A0A430RWB7_THESC|nr:response regulator transcription factor [Thermus scotoductus]RTG92307.1 DNA-binding response regulator [Thermus scotoductus]RTG93429.1 DNA-binding response regulator [Thermus scotoductus]RTH03582.1 DNA-binding response regulator [Thermus scotoductus]RTH06888.1 DNA-binding response regulator [Thermus scotoductus]RTH07825.1 DNA-binding response regulator [Thermus scotoductus]
MLRARMGNPGSRLRVLIADDHPLFRLGLRAGLEGEGLVVVAEAQDGKEALEKTLALNPEAVLLDLRMPVLDGLECTRMLRKKGYSGLVALLTTYQEPALVREAFLAGADAYFSKELSAPELKRRLLRVAQGEEKLKPPDLPSLTSREEEVLRLLAQGLSVKEMAKALGLSPDTVKDHLESLYGKLLARNRVEALEKARSLGFLAKK